MSSKYNYKEQEAHWARYWEEQGVYRYNPDSKKPVFSIDTPPPYASASHLHIGHAMSYTQAEIVARFHRMCGDEVFYPMGFDDNGLPTERYVEKKYKIEKHKVSREDFIELCLKETRLCGESYKKLWTRLGLSVDWDLLYTTISPPVRRDAQKSFHDLFNKGHLVRRDEPILWCPKCQTALAQADVDYEERPSAMHDIAFSSALSDDKLVISTTRPELIPACVALYVNPHDERYKYLHGQEAIVPITEQKVPVKTDESVDIEFGTGLMMVCTWGDAEDVRKWKSDRLDTRMILNKYGRLTDQVERYQGLTIKKARQAILTDLESAGLLLSSKPLSHNVGVHERCNTAVEFYKSPQWFIKVVDRKEELLRRGQELRWHPESMSRRYEDWVNNLKWDWCISRERYYGVPFPVWYCAHCNEVIVAELDEMPVDPQTASPRIGKCPKCGGEHFKGETDVMDTWMTSSITHLINAKWGSSEDFRPELFPTMTVRVQAFEIIRTWLFYTVVKAHYHTDSLPWKDVMISGWGLDPKGKKMSKSAGNSVDPDMIMDKYSADALRFWAAGASLGSNLRYSESDVASGRKLVTKLWNAARFAFGNLGDFTPDHPELRTAGKSTVDRWIISRLQQTTAQMTASLNEYAYGKAKDAIERFFWMDFCDNYLEIVKDYFWTSENYSPECIAAHKDTLYKVLFHIVQLYAPFVPFITEEVYHQYYYKTGSARPCSIHITAWPKLAESMVDGPAEAAITTMLQVLKAIRRSKTMASVNQNTRIECLTVAAADAALLSTLQELKDDLKSAARAKELVFVEQAGSDFSECDSLPIAINCQYGEPA